MPDAVPLRERFPRGCRVRLSAQGRTSFPRTLDVEFVVVGYGQKNQVLHVMPDGKRYRTTFHHTFLARVDAALVEDPFRVTTTCLTCGTEFSYLRVNKWRRHCSDRCRWKAGHRIETVRRRERKRHARAS